MFVLLVIPLVAILFPAFVFFFLFIPFSLLFSGLFEPSLNHFLLPYAFPFFYSFCFSPPTSLRYPLFASVSFLLQFTLAFPQPYSYPSLSFLPVLSLVLIS